MITSQQIAFIPARGNSKRLPRKNLKVFHNKPLIAWSIEAAFESECFSNVYVSTDDEEIANIAIKYGAEVPFLRPEYLARDNSSTIDVIKHFLSELNIDSANNVLCLLQPTSPLRSSKNIQSALSLLKSKQDCEAVVSVCETDHSPMWTNTLPADLSMKDFIKPELKNVRSQDLPPYFIINGAIYIAEIRYLLENNGFLGDKTFAHIMGKEESIDIDTPLDFILAHTIKESNE